MSRKYFIITPRTIRELIFSYPSETGRELRMVPGLPLIGNLLQLKDKKPHRTFGRWAEEYGPIYSIRLGHSTVFVLKDLNDTSLAKEAMVTKFSSITTKKFPRAWKILTAKSMVASSQDTMTDNILRSLHTHAMENLLEPVNLREICKLEIFGLTLKQAFGKDIQSSLYVKGLGKTFTRDEIFNILVIDPIVVAIDMDWRDFFPYLSWVPNKSFEMKVQHVTMRVQEVMKTLFQEQKKRISMGEEVTAFVGLLLSEGTNLTETQLIKLIWETIIAGTDTTLVAIEWAMYELAKNPKYQDHLYREIQKVCGNSKYAEEPLAYLSAIFHETLRKHSPAPFDPLRYVHEDTQLGGHDIPAGSEIAINIYGCPMDKEQYDLPEEWRPERFLDDKYDPAGLFNTMAFGSGKRACAGALQAKTIFCTVVGRLIQDFEWSLKEGEEDDVNTGTLTSQKHNPMLAMITPRDNSHLSTGLA
ncbi:hypothetical protein MKW98_002820 [Papaver atlanticum]|uniref:Cytochrome P450 n=1 Tax=Papaver atlanticum TaxID=357466 RepID=A0AAD4S6U3_9MAGN|nr:hypothetical protein MKW98_002820 [Papaver atlanticum]